jgi:hypothetical protein
MKVDASYLKIFSNMFSFVLKFASKIIPGFLQDTFYRPFKGRCLCIDGGVHMYCIGQQVLSDLICLVDHDG